MMDVFDLFTEAYQREAHEEMSLHDFLLGCRDDATMYATAAERMIAAIGEAEVVDTSQDPVSARARRRRQVVFGRATEAAH